MTRKKRGNEISIIEMERQFRVEELILQGMGRGQIAVRLGVTTITIQKDEELVYKRWAAMEKNSGEVKAEAVRSAEYGAFKAIQAFEVSKQNAETITTDYVNRRCKECGGTGWEDGTEESGRWCTACKGEGTVVVEEVTRTVKGHAGDAALLAEYRKNKELVAKYRGLLAKEKKEPEAIQQHVHIHAGVDYSQVPSEQLIEAKRMLARLAAAAKPIIEVEKEE